ncbi:MAG TPA: OsmC family protein [Candidatus Eisenbacteria bacterium]|nr:OsmC family protein [Candidatus Eisenbacteria bacterium]
MQRKATAQWSGGLKDGRGQLTTDSKALANVPYNFAKRFENEPGTNPEELVAAAHAGCYAMALSGALGKAGKTADSISTIATVTLETKDGAPTVTAIHLDVTARVPNMDATEFQSAAEDTKKNCPISRLLAPGTTITMSAKLEAGAGVR